MGLWQQAWREGPLSCRSVASGSCCHQAAAGQGVRDQKGVGGRLPSARTGVRHGGSSWGLGSETSFCHVVPRGHRGAHAQWLGPRSRGQGGWKGDSPCGGGTWPLRSHRQAGEAGPQGRRQQQGQQWVSSKGPRISICLERSPVHRDVCCWPSWPLGSPLSPALEVWRRSQLSRDQDAGARPARLTRDHRAGRRGGKGSAAEPPRGGGRCRWDRRPWG